MRKSRRRVSRRKHRKKSRRYKMFAEKEKILKDAKERCNMINKIFVLRCAGKAHPKWSHDYTRNALNIITNPKLPRELRYLILHLATEKQIDELYELLDLTLSELSLSPPSSPIDGSIDGPYDSEYY